VTAYLAFNIAANGMPPTINYEFIVWQARLVPVDRQKDCLHVRHIIFSHL
jgi:hypothetical protein